MESPEIPLQSETASVVRLLDKGMLADQHGEGMEFVVLEKAALPVKEYIFSVSHGRAEYLQRMIFGGAFMDRAVVYGLSTSDLQFYALPFKWTLFYKAFKV